MTAAPTETNTDANLGRRAAVQAAGTVLSRVTGFGRVFALAYALDAHRLADTYLLANNTPNIIYELVLGGVLSGTVLPVLVRALKGTPTKPSDSEATDVTPTIAITPAQEGEPTGAADVAPNDLPERSEREPAGGWPGGKGPGRGGVPAKRGAPGWEGSAPGQDPPGGGGHSRDGGGPARDDTDWHAISAVVTVSVVASAVLAVAFVVVAPWFVRLYTLRNSGEVAADQLAVATRLLRLFAPQVFFYGLISVSTALLGAQRRFAAPKFAPVLNNLVVIAVLMSYPTLIGTRDLGEVRHRYSAILLLGLGTTAGVAAMALAQVPWRNIGRDLRWVWDPRHPAVRTIVRLSGWTAAFVAANQVTLFLVYFLANDRAGDVAVYVFAYTIFLLPHGVASVSIIDATRPELADRAAARDIRGLQKEIGRGLRMIAAIAVPAAAGYVVLAQPIVSLLLEHGALERGAAREVASTLALFAIGLPAFSAWLFLGAVYQGMQDTRSLFFLYLVENSINAIGAIVLYPLLGVQGLALAFAFAYIAGSAAGIFDLRRRLGGVDGARVAKSIVRIAAATAIMVVAVVLVSRNVGATTGAGAAVRAAVAAVVGVTVYLASARVLGVGELASLLSVRRRA